MEYRGGFSAGSVKTMGGLNKSKAFAKGKHGMLPNNSPAPKANFVRRRKGRVNKEPSQWVAGTQL